MPTENADKQACTQEISEENKDILGTGVEVIHVTL